MSRRAESESLAVQIAAVLRKRIITGQLHPNERLLETDIAEEAGTSRAPVREALRQLVSEGLATNSGRRGTFVAKFSPQDIREIFTLRALIEGYAAALMTERMTRQDISYLQGIIVQMEEAAMRGDYAKITGLNILFHQYIIELTNHGRLAALWKSMSRQISMIMIAIAQFYPSLEGVADRHRLVAEAIASKDPKQAETTVKEHILSTGEELLRNLQRKGGEEFLL